MSGRLVCMPCWSWRESEGLQGSIPHGQKREGEHMACCHHPLQRGRWTAVPGLSTSRRLGGETDLQALLFPKGEGLRGTPRGAHKVALEGPLPAQACAEQTCQATKGEEGTVVLLFPRTSTTQTEALERDKHRTDTGTSETQAVDTHRQGKRKGTGGAARSERGQRAWEAGAASAVGALRAGRPRGTMGERGKRSVQCSCAHVCSAGCPLAGS